jgi:hypothetical protein
MLHMVRRARVPAIAAGSVLAAVTLWAASPHFVGKVTATLEGSNVRVAFKEAGLGNNQLITYVASAEGTATYVCVNNGGQCPNAANKVTVSGPVSATGTFNSGDNGQITQSLTLSPPSAGSFTCPGGQTLTLADVSYTNITITDTTNNVSAAATPSSLSATVFVCPNP